MEKPNLSLICPVAVVPDANYPDSAPPPRNFVHGSPDPDKKTKKDIICCYVPDPSVDIRIFSEVHEYAKNNPGSVYSSPTGLKKFLHGGKKKVANGWDMHVYDPDNKIIHGKTLKSLAETYNLSFTNLFQDEELEALKKLVPAKKKKEGSKVGIIKKKASAPPPPPPSPSSVATPPVSEEGEEVIAVDIGDDEDDDELKASLAHTRAQVALKRARKDVRDTFEHLKKVRMGK